MSDVLERLKSALADRYTVERELGSGGMAVVYLARDLRHERPVAIKVLRPELMSVVAAERFLREIKLTAGLAHPHILPVLDSGEADGFLYYVMPHVEGESLRERLDREGQLPVSESVRIAREAADALNYAHEHKLLHRDIKPENILLQADHAVVADFGIAKALTRAAGDRLTDTGISIGTPTYMSPEQAAGEREITEASDIYSLACVLYEMLTGEPPINDTSVQKIVSRKLLGDFQPAKDVSRDVSLEVDSAVSKALATEPAERFSGATEFADALGGTASVVRTGKAKRQWLPWAALATVAVIATGWLVFGGDRETTTVTDERPTVAVLPLVNMSGREEDAYFIDGMHDEILTQLSKISGLSVRGRTSVMQYRSSPKNLRQIGEELNARYLLEGGVQRAGGTVGINVRLVDSGSDESIFADSYDRELSAENLLAVQREVALRIADALKATITVQEREQIDRAPTDNLEAYDFYFRGREYVRNPDFRYRNYRGAQRMFEQAVELDSSFALAHAWLSQAHSRIYWFRYDETDDRLHKMRSSVNRALELDRELPEAHLALATYHYFGYREYDKALEALSRAEQLRPGGADVIFLRGGIYRRQGRWEEALEAFKQAAEFDPRSPDLLAEIGQLYRFLRRYDEAERYADLALAVEPESWFAASLKAQVRLQRDGNLAAWRTLVSRHPEQALDLMRVELLHRDYPAALAALSGVADEILSFQSAYYPKSLYAGLIHLAAGEVRLAQAEFESARIMLEAAVAERPNGARHRALGLAYAGLGLKEAALREGRTAVELLPLSKDAWHWGSSHQIALAQIYTMVGEYDAAIDQIDYLLSIPSGAYAPLHGIDLSVPELRIDPTWDPIRDNPRFQALLEK